MLLNLRRQGPCGIGLQSGSGAASKGAVLSSVDFHWSLRCKHVLRCSTLGPTKSCSVEAHQLLEIQLFSFRVCAGYPSVFVLLASSVADSTDNCHSGRMTFLFTGCACDGMLLTLYDDTFISDYGVHRDCTTNSPPYLSLVAY